MCLIFMYCLIFWIMHDPWAPLKDSACTEGVTQAKEELINKQGVYVYRGTYMCMILFFFMVFCMILFVICV